MTKTKDWSLNFPWKQTAEHCPRAVMSEMENILVIWEMSVSHKLFILRQSPLCRAQMTSSVSSFPASACALFTLCIPICWEKLLSSPCLSWECQFMPVFFLMLSNSWPKDHFYETLLKVVVIIKKLQDSKHFPEQFNLSWTILPTFFSDLMSIYLVVHKENKSVFQRIYKRWVYCYPVITYWIFCYIIFYITYL